MLKKVPKITVNDMATSSKKGILFDSSQRSTIGAWEPQKDPQMLSIQHTCFV
jgi:hypothetical protein